jgi:putative lipoic acid-binding regulatory protein
MASDTLLEFPCDHMFKVFGPHDEQFVAEVRSAVSRVTPVTRDAMKCRPSSGGAHQCVSVLVRLHDYPQLLAVYSALKQVPRISYLL